MYRLKIISQRDLTEEIKVDYIPSIGEKIMCKHISGRIVDIIHEFTYNQIIIIIK